MIYSTAAPSHYSGEGDGDSTGVTCSDMSGVLLGEAVAGDGDAPVGEFSFSEDGTCISESKESLGVTVGLGVGDVAFSGVGVACSFRDVASLRGASALDRFSGLFVRSFGVGFAVAVSSNLPCTIVPETVLETV
jgi:hypothetical protein